MSYITLPRLDNTYEQNSYVNIYKIKDLEKINEKYKDILLRVVKKSILGTNFTYFYKIRSLFLTFISLIIINNIIPFIKDYFFSDNLKDINNNILEISINTINNDSNKNDSYLLNFFGMNLIFILFLVYKIFKYRYSKTKINNYMQKLTQCSIEKENEFLKNNFYCSISSDNKFSIEIYSDNKNNINNTSIKSDKIFFEYVINFPNIKYFNSYNYESVLLPKEKEIIKNIDNITYEIDEKNYKIERFSFLIIIFFIIPFILYLRALIKIPFLFAKFAKIFFIFFIAILIIITRIYFSFKNKIEIIEKVLLLKNNYIKDGYYIYINKYIISIFFLKEKYRNYQSINIINRYNKKLQHELKLI